MPSPTPEILRFSEDNLYSALSNRHCLPHEVARNKQASRLAERYLNKVGAETIIVETQYVDGNYIDDFTTFYAKCFGHYDKTCKRLHFFSLPPEHLTQDFFRRIIREQATKEEVEQFQKAYIGFIVARPLPNAIIGRTVLKTYDSDGGRRHYPCTRSYTANLCGIPLQVEKSLAFQEQDAVVAACATVALWCCFQKTADLFGTPNVRPAAITQLANEVVGASRPIPSTGLNILQMCGAVSKFGLEPEVVQVTGDVPILSLIQAYLKAELPVILLANIEDLNGGHAITLTGYSVSKDSKHASEVDGDEKFISMTGLRIEKFYGHDDQVGPFTSMEIVRLGEDQYPAKTKSGEKKHTAVHPLALSGGWIDETTGKVLKIFPSAILVPVYTKMRVKFHDVQSTVTRLNDILEKIALKIFDPKDELEWDIYLTNSNDYKSNLKKSFNGDVSVLEEMLTRHHPRFLWRAKLVIEGIEILEILADATDFYGSFYIYSILWHHDEMRSYLQNLIEVQDPRNEMKERLGDRFYSFLIDGIAKPLHFVERNLPEGAIL